MVTHVSSSFTFGEFSGTTWYQCVCSIVYTKRTRRLSGILAPVGFSLTLHVTSLKSVFIPC